MTIHPNHRNHRHNVLHGTFPRFSRSHIYARRNQSVYLKNIARERAVTTMGTERWNAPHLGSGSQLLSMKPGFHSQRKCAWRECGHGSPVTQVTALGSAGSLPNRTRDTTPAPPDGPPAILLMKAGCRPRPGPDKHADKPELRKLGLSLKVKVHSAGPRQGLRKAYPTAQPNSIRYSAPKIELKSASVSGAFRSLPPGRPWARHFGDTHLTSHLPQALKADSVPGQVRARGVDGGEGHRSLNCLASASSSVTGGSISSSRTEGGDVRQGPSST